MDLNSPLTGEQQQREAALETANRLLSAYQKPADPEHLMAVAEWIVEPDMARRRSAEQLRRLFAKPTTDEWRAHE